jgi:hypothetical protein
MSVFLPVGGKLAGPAVKKITASAASKAPVIIGETMARVEAAAAKIPGSKILDDMPNFRAMKMTDEQITNAMMEHNRKWLLEQIKSGRPIIDIGLDPARSNRSVFYEMEQTMLKNYKKLHPDFDNLIRRP